MTEEESVFDCNCVCVPLISEQLLAFLAAGGLYISTVGTDLAKNIYIYKCTSHIMYCFEKYVLSLTLIYYLCITYSYNHLVAVAACIPETLKATVGLPSRQSYPFVLLQGLFCTQEHSALGPNLFTTKTMLRLILFVESYCSKRIAITIIIMIRNIL